MANITTPDKALGDPFTFGEYNAFKTAINSKVEQAQIDAAIAALRNGVPTAGNDLSKLYTLIQAVSAIVGGSTADGNSVVDTVAELLTVFATYPEGVTLVNSLAAKLDVSTYNANRTADQAVVAINANKIAGIAGGAITTAAEAVNGIYVPLFTNHLLLSGSTGLAVGSGGGIVAAVSGTTGSGSLYLPRPIDPTKPWRGAVLVELNDTQMVDISFADANGDLNYATNFHLNQGVLSADWAGYQAFMGTYGYGNTIPVGTKVWVGLVSDGVTVQVNLIPYAPDMISGYIGAPGYQAAWNNTGMIITTQPISYSNSGHKVFGDNTTDAQYRYCRLIVSTKSTVNRVLGAFWAQGLGGPNDGQLQPPFLLKTKILQDSTAFVACPGNQGVSPIDLVMLPHPNASDNVATLSTATIGTQLTKMYNNGYLIFGIQGSVNSAGYTDATSSNWGAGAGMRYRKAQLEWIRANIPLTKNLYVVGQSMGLLNALSFAYQYPSAVRAIVGISGVTDLNDSFTNWGFSSIIQKAYGTWYVCIQAGTGQTPASQPTYWTPISFGFGAPDEVYYSSPYVWRDSYASGTAYAVNDIVCVASTGGVTTFSFNNPMFRPSLFKNIPIKLWHGSADSLIPASQATNFQAVVNASGGNVSVVTVSGGTHLGNTMYDGQAIVDFLKANP